MEFLTGPLFSGNHVYVCGDQEYYIKRLYELFSDELKEMRCHLINAKDLNKRLFNIEVYSYDKCKYSRRHEVKTHISYSLDPEKTHFYRETKVLIIYNIEMISAELFDLYDQIGKQIKNNPMLPWGGMQLILFGDFYKSSIFDPSFAFQSNSWRMCFNQTNSFNQHIPSTIPILVNVLENIRNGLDVYPSFFASDDIISPYDPNSHVQIFTDNYEMNGHNIKYHSRFRGRPLQKISYPNRTLHLKIGIPIITTEDIYFLPQNNGMYYDTNIENHEIVENETSEVKEEESFSSSSSSLNKFMEADGKYKIPAGTYCHLYDIKDDLLFLQLQENLIIVINEHPIKETYFKQDLENPQNWYVEEIIIHQEYPIQLGFAMHINLFSSLPKHLLLNIYYLDCSNISPTQLYLFLSTIPTLSQFKLIHFSPQLLSIPESILSFYNDSCCSRRV